MDRLTLSLGLGEKLNSVCYIMISAQAADGGIRIWCQHHELMDPTCIVSTVQAGGRGCQSLRNVFLANVGPPKTNQSGSECHGLIVLLLDMHSFIFTISPFSDGFFHNRKAPCHKSKIESQTGFISSYS